LLDSSIITCDQRLAIGIVKNVASHTQTKYIDISDHWIQKFAYSGKLAANNISSRERDFFAKALLRPQSETKMIIEMFTLK